MRVFRQSYPTDHTDDQWELVINPTIKVAKIDPDFSMVPDLKRIGFAIPIDKAK